MERLSENINLTMLVDDNDIDNYISKRVIGQTKFSKRLKVCNSSVEALDYLSKNQNNLDNIPEIIFLDMRMLDADAFTFIGEFEKLNKNVKDRSKLIILSNTADKKLIGKIVKNKYIINFIPKPLRKQLIEKLKQGHDSSNIMAMKLA